MQTLTFNTKPVSVNKRYTISRGRNILSNEYRSAKEAMQWEAKSQWQGEPLDDDVTVNILLHLDSKRPDIDGYLKIILDSIDGIAYHNDRQITELTVHKLHNKKHPHVVVQVL